MKFYIAAHISEKDWVKSIQELLQSLGHQITVDWTSYPGVFGQDREQYPDKVREIAVRDMQGVMNSDILVLLAEPADGRAKYAELGAAIMSQILCGKPRIYVIGEDTSQSVFYYHPTVKRIKAIEEMLADLRL